MAPAPLLPVLHDVAAASRAIRRAARWARRHPVRTMMIAAAVWLVVSVAGGNVMLAQAASGGVKSLPYLSPLDLKDSGGVDLLHYVFLPFDHGNPLFSPGKWFVAQMVDPIWLFNVVCLSWSMWALQFLVTMQWVGWVATPVQAIFATISGVLSQIGWIPVGLALTALICFVAIFRGRVAAGVTEIGISVAASVLAVTLLANPVGLITGPTGGLSRVQQWSASISASIAGGDSALLGKQPTAQQAGQIVSSTLMTQVMNVWVRLPAQEIAFGQVLTGSCAKTYDTAMMQVNPLDTGSTSTVRDAVKGCDADAANYASNPTIGMAFTAGIATTGAFILNLMAWAVGLLLLLATGYTLLKAVQWFFATYAAIAPGIARRAWWSSMLGVLVGLFTIGATVVLVTGFLKIATDVMTALAKSKIGGGLPVVAQMGILDLIVITMIIALFWNWMKAKKAGERLADRLARLGFGRPSGPRQHPIAQTAKRMGERYISDRLANRMRNRRPVTSSLPRPAVAAGSMKMTASRLGGEAATATATATAPAAAAAVGAARPLLALPASGGHPGGMKAAAARMAGVGVSVGLAAATGGTSAAVLALTKEGGKYVLQRGITHAMAKDEPRTPAGLDPAPAARALPAGHLDRDRQERVERPTFTGYGRRIEVDGNGVSRVAPKEAVQHGGVYRITTAKKISPATANLRERLRKAAAAAPAGRS